MVPMGRTRCRGRTVVVPMARGRLAVVLVRLMLLQAGSRFAVVTVVGGRVSLRAVRSVVVRGCLGYGGQQGCHSYKDEFFHDCNENYVKVIKKFRFDNLSVGRTRTIGGIYTIFYFFLSGSDLVLPNLGSGYIVATWLQPLKI